MRVRIIFSVLNKGGIVPFHHQLLLSEFIKSVLRTHPRFPFHHAVFNFSGLKGQSKVTQEGLFYESSRVTLVFSSPDREFVTEFLAALFSIDRIFIGTLLLKPIELVEESGNIQLDSYKYVCISPLILISEGLPPSELRKFIHPESPEFLDLLYDSTMTRLEKSGRFERRDLKEFVGFRFMPDLEYLEKSRNQDKKYSRIYRVNHRGSECELRGYTLPFVLEAHPEVHEFIFHSGLGEDTGEGFGMVDFAQRERFVRMEVLSSFQTSYSRNG